MYTTNASHTESVSMSSYLYDACDVLFSIYIKFDTHFSVRHL